MGFLSKLFGGGESAFTNLDINSYKQQYVDTHTDHVLVDVRSKGEFSSGHLPNAINIPLNELSKRSGEIAKDKPVVVVCASGSRSRSGARVLANAGFSDVFNLKGGTAQWAMRGLPIE